LVYMRKTIVPSLLQAIKENQNRDEIKLFELANTYVPAKNDLPKETLMLAGVIYKNNVSFFEGKGIIEQLLIDLGIKKYKFNEPEKGGVGASIYIGSDRIGEIELLDDKTLDFELNFEILLKHANSKKHYKGIFKYPPVIEDIALIIDPKIKTGRIIEEIKKQSGLIKEITLLDTFKDSRTFHIIYQDPSKNLSAEEIASVRKKIIKNLEAQFNAELKK
ncbi:hypothetical protein KKG52_01680, partial [Patescibacteria group bacterium]|nr:hypothetical protein [Patescibacteria group bacterium]